MTMTAHAKRNVFLISLTMAGTATLIHAQATAVTIPAGSNLRVSLDKGSPLHKAGQPVSATLRSPLYVGEILAAPTGTRVGGHVVDIVAGSKSLHVSRLLRGDFTPPRIAEVAIDSLILADGTRIAVHTAPTQGMEGVREVHFIPNGQRPGVKSQFREALDPYRAPHKLQRFTEAAMMTLPYHANYLDQGMVFDAVLESEVTLAEPVAPKVSLIPVSQVVSDEPRLLHLKLVNAISSNSSVDTSSVAAEVTQPFYDSRHMLVYPVGSTLKGIVTRSQAAGWLHKNGRLSFTFDSISLPGEEAIGIHATLDGIKVSGGQNVAVSNEGDLRVTTSRLQQGVALAGLMGPSLALADATYSKTAFQRAGFGQRGFGILGAGAGQATASTAIGFGYYSAARWIYAAFIAKGTDVTLPANAPLCLRLDVPPSAASVSTMAQSDHPAASKASSAQSLARVVPVSASNVIDKTPR